MKNLLLNAYRRMAAIFSRLPRALFPHIEPQPEQQEATQQDAAGPTGADTEQEFTGSPEEALLLMQLPPNAKIKRFIILPISQAGEIPSFVEEVKLTPHGKKVARTEFLTMDGHQTVGRPEMVKGFCPACGRFSFQGGACEGCGQFVCPGCMVPFEEGTATHRLCPACGKRARWSKNTWQ